MSLNKCSEYEFLGKPKQYTLAGVQSGAKPLQTGGIYLNHHDALRRTTVLVVYVVHTLVSSTYFASE